MSVRRPTREQARASDPRKSVWVTANAGTGKTRVLSDRVLRLLLDGAHPESILCITFTKAAAVEMTARIDDALASWAVETDDQRLSEQLMAITGDKPDERSLAFARRLFARILDLPHGLSIQTIHSFCTGLLRRFPIEAGIPPHFVSIDDRTAAEMMRESKHRLLGPLRESDERLASSLDQISSIMAESTFEELLAEILQKRRDIERALEDGLAPLEQRVFEILDVPVDYSPVELVERACADGMMDVERLKHAVEALLLGVSSDQQRAKTIASWLEMTPDDRVRNYEVYKSAFLTQAGEGRKSLATKRVATASPAALDALIFEQVRLVRLEDQLKSAITARRTNALLRVAHALLLDYRQAKDQAAALDYDDLIHFSARLLSAPNRRLWVLYKLDARIDHILVDEAQDTSPDQWQIIMNLIEELSSGKGISEKPRTLFVVGDEKQSIYSFQGADLAGYRRVQQQIASGLDLNEERLEVSFRSCAAILDFVDIVLGDLEVHQAVLGDRPQARHKSFRVNDEGIVTLWPLQQPSAINHSSEPWQLPDEATWHPKTEELHAKQLAKEIERRLQLSEPLASTGQPLRPRDILVLVSRRGTIQELLIKGLKKRGIPVAGADRLELTKHIAVRDLIALGQVLLLPEDDLTLACLLKSPLIGMSEEELFELSYQREQASLFEALGKKRERFPMAYGRIREWLAQADFVPPYELFSGILASGGRQRLLARLGPDAVEPIEAFLGQALAYEQGHPATLQGFLHWLTMDESSLKRDSETLRDEVRVMTVHGAKGLEAPFVILADAGPHQPRLRGKILFDSTNNLPFWQGNQSERDHHTERLLGEKSALAEQEHCRLLYVALTRAKDALLITGWNTRRPGEVEKSWYGRAKTALESLEEVERLPIENGEECLQLKKGVGKPAQVINQSLIAKPQELPEWARRPLPPEPQKPAPLAPSKLTQMEPPAASPLALSGALEFGLQMHKYLHYLADLDLPQRQLVLDELSNPQLVDEIHSVLEMPELSPVFGPGSLAEQPLIGRIGEHLISGQIDRMVVLEDRVIIVDFKTNRYPPRSIETIAKTYLRQLAAYALLLQRIYPQKTIETALVWTAIPRMMPVSAQHLHPYQRELLDQSAARA